MTSLIAVINYEEFYNIEAPADPIEFIKDYPTDVLLMVFSRVNSILFHEKGETYQCQVRILREVFSQLDEGKRKLLLHQYSRRRADNDGEGPVFFSDQAVSWLIGHCFRNYVPIPEGYDFNEAELQSNAFDSILTANKTYFKAQEQYELDTYESVWHLVLKQQLYVRNVGPMLKDGAVKIHMFRNFLLNQVSNGKDLMKEFKVALGLRSFFDYASVYLAAIRNLFTGYREKNQISWILKIDPASRQLVETFALRPADIASKKFKGLYGSIIPKPVYFILNNFPVIIDYNFLGFLVNTAFAYNFYFYTSLKTSKTVNEYLSFLGKEFYESFASGRLLQNIFSRARFFSGKDLQEYTDFAAIREEKDVFLFEVKSTSVHYDVLEQVNVEEFKKNIEEDFLQKKGVSEGSKNKGVHQLVNAIYQMRNGKLFPETSQLKPLKQCKIYPVIIYTDPAYDTHAVNNYCNDHFQKAIEELKQDFNHIYPLTMINLDFFIAFYPQLKSKPYLLSKLIKDYHDRVSSGLSSFRKSKAPYHFLNTNIGFAYFVYKTQPDPGASIRSISEDLNLGYGDSAEEDAW